MYRRKEILHEPSSFLKRLRERKQIDRTGKVEKRVHEKRNIHEPSSFLKRVFSIKSVFTNGSSNILSVTGLLSDLQAREIENRSILGLTFPRSASSK